MERTTLNIKLKGWVSFIEIKKRAGGNGINIIE